MELDDKCDELLLGDGTEERKPRDLIEPDPVFKLAFHPNAPVLCCGLISGVINVHEFRQNETRAVASIKTHKAGVSAMEFTRSGTHLATVSSDRHIKVLDCTSQQNVIDIKRKESPHKEGLSAMTVCTTTELAVGDDDGRISVWDMRQRKPVLTWHEHADQVTGMIYFEGNQQLVTCSMDTTIGIFDIRMKKVAGFSEKRKDELNCMIFMPATNNIVCGTDSGLLPIWKYGSWSRPYDVHGKHPKECEALLTYNDNIFFSGAFDGVVRVIQHNPVRRVLAHFSSGQRHVHNTTSSLSISHDRKLLATTSSDRVVKFFDIEFLGNEQELDKLRSWAERRHMETIRKATKEDKEESEEDSDEWSTDSSNVEHDESDDGHVASHRPMQRTDEPLDRTTKRERMAASRWLKTAQKDRINFTADNKKKRTKGFWSDLLDEQ
jgi:WD40 repeat protein